MHAKLCNHFSFNHYVQILLLYPKMYMVHCLLTFLFPMYNTEQISNEIYKIMNSVESS